MTGLIEVWQQPNRPAAAVPGFKQYMGLMAELSARYQRNQMLRQMTGQEQLWTQLETFARQVHGSLKPTRGRLSSRQQGPAPDRVRPRRRGRRLRSRPRRIEAVSGADVVEKRSNAVRLMRRPVANR